MRSWPSRGAVSRRESYGGTWTLNRAPAGLASPAARSSRRWAMASSGYSRGVFHGVLLVQPVVSSSWPGATSTISPSASATRSPPCSRQHVVDQPRVVVAGGGEDADLRAGQPLVGVPEPAAQRLGHQLGEQLLDRVRVGLQVLVLLGGHAPGVAAGHPRLALQLGRAVVVQQPPPAVDPGLVPPVRLGDQRDDHLAGEVAAQDQQVGAVEAGRGDELPEAGLGAVQVGGEEDGRRIGRRPAPGRPRRRRSGATSVHRLAVVDVLPPLHPLPHPGPDPPADRLRRVPDRGQQGVDPGGDDRAGAVGRRAVPQAGQVGGGGVVEAPVAGQQPGDVAGVDRLAGRPAAPGPGATGWVARRAAASIRSVTVWRTIWSFWSRRSSTGTVSSRAPRRSRSSIVWQNSSRSTNTSSSRPLAAWRKEKRRPSMATSRSRSISQPCSSSSRRSPLRSSWRQTTSMSLAGRPSRSRAAAAGWQCSRMPVEPTSRSRCPRDPATSTRATAASWTAAQAGRGACPAITRSGSAGRRGRRRSPAGAGTAGCPGTRPPRRPRCRARSRTPATRCRG